MKLLQSLARSRACRLRHRFSRWAFVMVDDMPGYEPLRREDLQFRMCAACGHQEIRERA